MSLADVILEEVYNNTNEIGKVAFSHQQKIKKGSPSTFSWSLDMKIALLVSKSPQSSYETMYQLTIFS